MISLLAYALRRPDMFLSEAECCYVLSLSFGTAAAAAVRSGGIGGRVVR